MRYKLSIDRTVNRLVPHYLSGRKFILFVQSCLYPLQRTNEWFRSFTRERHIEARMTSQVIYFEWFLNYRFVLSARSGIAGAGIFLPILYSCSASTQRW